MRIFGYEIKKAPQAQTDQQQGLNIQWMGGTWIPYEDTMETFIKEGIYKNPHIAAIVGRIIDKAISIPFYAYSVKDAKKVAKYESMTGGEANEKSLANARIYKSQALGELPANHALNKLLEKPNEVQSFQELLADFVGYDCLAGEQIMRKQGVSFSEKGFPLEMYALPPHLVTFVADSKYLGVKGYKWAPDNIDMDVESIVVAKRWNPLLYDSYFLRGLSPLRAMLATIQASNEAQDTMRKMFINQGPPMVVFPEGEGILIEKKTNEIKEAFRSYIVKNRKGEIMVNNSKLGKIDLGVSPVDLAILDSDVANLQNLCNAYGVDSLLFGKTKDRSGTAAELEYARKRMVLDAVLPILVRFRAMINKVFQPMGYYIDFDYSGLPEMQSDMKAMAEALRLMPYVTYAEKREFTGWTRDERAEYQDLLNDYTILSSERPYLLDIQVQDTQNNGVY